MAVQDYRDLEESVDQQAKEVNQDHRDLVGQVVELVSVEHKVNVEKVAHLEDLAPTVHLVLVVLTDHEDLQVLVA